MDHARIPLAQLAWPILVENVLRTSLMSVDTLMLARYSAEAVAAMSLVNQFAFLVQLLFMVVSVGASVHVAQNLGAGRRSTAELFAAASLALVVVFAAVISAAMALGAPALVRAYRLAPGVASGATSFLVIYGGLSIFTAINIVQASILRSFGHARDPMVVNAASLGLAVAGNALCLFGPEDFPVRGVAGVAWSTVLSQLAACLASAWALRRRGIHLPLRGLREVPARVYRAILAVGVPTAGEYVSYNLSQGAILAMLSTMGTDALAAYGIAMAVLRYVFIPGVSIGAAAQLRVGYLVGAGKHDDAARRVLVYFAWGFGISAVLAGAVYLARAPLIAIFTGDPAVAGLVAAVLLVAVVHEPGRDFNTIIIPALKGAGDVRFPVYAGLVSMWGISVAGAWFLGLRMGLGITGVWLAMAADEWLRGLAMVWRWRSGVWRRFKLLTPEEELGAVAGTAQVATEEGL
ncbi:MAG: MATE family efflux transporter [Anaeromyxobacter sp.]